MRDREIKQNVEQNQGLEPLDQASFSLGARERLSHSELVDKLSKFFGNDLWIEDFRKREAAGKAEPEDYKLLEDINTSLIQSQQKALETFLDYYNSDTQILLDSETGGDTEQQKRKRFAILATTLGISEQDANQLYPQLESEEPLVRAKADKTLGNLAKRAVQSAEGLSNLFSRIEGIKLAAAGATLLISLDTLRTELLDLGGLLSEASERFSGGQLDAVRIFRPVVQELTEEKFFARHEAPKLLTKESLRREIADGPLRRAPETNYSHEIKDKMHNLRVVEEDIFLLQEQLKIPGRHRYGKTLDLNVKQIEAQSLRNQVRELLDRSSWQSVN